MQAREFLGSERARRRYWARSAVGWPKIASARPNAAHFAIAELERKGIITGLITQNVDRLHHAAGSSPVELHGALADVRCLACGALHSRAAVQARILADNVGFRAEDFELAPDGDADTSEAHDFVAPACDCGGALKPDVVFFGESVPKPKVDRAYAMVDEADALLVVGSSLAVFSGYRFVLRARDQKKPIALVNLGESRGDAYAELVIEARAGEVLPRAVRAL